ncbi:hypothetical protein [Cytobacillus oceanisediminis]|uniref:hypothetical protein n=1 Tax=Cytobacillus oceanisediminis TaxID=665099 RepID=UPI001FB40878|nr:hypothetical protein [Cytobacillus oceanisediminis]UOE58055.1 hypothetical protein IRB79_27720 [Cytobacillus oceanisediminis]
MEYLQNYLSVLPQYDRREVEQLIQENLDLFEVKVITKEEFEALIQQLANRKEKVTKLEAAGEKVDAEHFNRMHSDVSLDLKRLYNSHLVVEKVVANYNRILKGTLDDVQREVDSLKTRVEELNLKAKGENGLIVKTYGFEEKDKNLHMETDREQYAHLFLDRDGKSLKSATLNRNFHQHYLSLPSKETYSALQNTNGTVTAKIEVEYQAANVIEDLNHPLNHAIDDSKETYWAQAVAANAPAYTEIKKR